MRFQILIALCLFKLLCSPNAAAAGYDLKFNITGLQDSMCYLANYYGDKQYLKDSARANAGHVNFKGAEELPSGIYLFVFPNKTYFEVVIDKQQNFLIECNQTEVINSIKIKGSTDNELFYQYLAYIQKKSKEVEPLKAERKRLLDAKEKTTEIDEQIKAIDKSVVDFKMKFISDHPDAFMTAVFKASQDPVVPEIPVLADGSKDSTFPYRYYKAHYFDNMSLADERLLRTPVYHSRLSYYMKNLVPQIPDSIIKESDSLIALAKPNKETFKYVVWYITNTYETSNIMGMDQVFVHMAKNYYTKELAYWVDDATLFKIQDRASILEPILIGKKVKNLVLTDTTNAPRSLYNVKAKYTILFFWDPDCGHCKKVTPFLKTYYEQVKSKDVEVFAVCTEVEIDKWKKYISDNQLKWINVADPKLQNNFRHEFDISSTPQIFLLDSEKKILAKKIDEVTLEKILNKELGLPPPAPREPVKDDSHDKH